MIACSEQNQLTVKTVLICATFAKFKHLTTVDDSTKPGTL